MYCVTVMSNNQKRVCPLWQRGSLETSALDVAQEKYCSARSSEHSGLLARVAMSQAPSVHSSESITDKEAVHECVECGKVYTTKAILQRHMKKSHGHSPARKGRHICPVEGCDEVLYRADLLCRHLENEHSIDPGKYNYDTVL